MRYMFCKWCEPIPHERIRAGAAGCFEEQKRIITFHKSDTRIANGAVALPHKRIRAVA